MNTAKLDQFMAAYTPALKAAVIGHPDEYPWPVENVPVVAERMRAAIVAGSYNHSGHGFKGACKSLGIKHTRKAIAAFLE